MRRPMPTAERTVIPEKDQDKTKDDLTEEIAIRERLRLAIMPSNSGSLYQHPHPWHSRTGVMEGRPTASQATWPVKWHVCFSLNLSRWD